jgi:lactate permease
MQLTDSGPLSRKDMLLAFAPYVIVVLGVVSIGGVTALLDNATNAVSWPGLHVVNSKGKAPTSETFKLNWLTAAGTWLLVSGLLTMIFLRVRPALGCGSTGAR